MRLSHTTVNDNVNNNYFYHMAKSVLNNVIGQFAVHNLLYGSKFQQQMLFSQL